MHFFTAGESGAGGGGGGATIFVKNFDKYGSEDDIRQSLGDFFSQCGSVLDIRIPTERETGSIKGFAFIKFETEEAKQEAINLNGRYGFLYISCFPFYITL